jgi:GGDEF domain-containing protein
MAPKKLPGLLGVTARIVAIIAVVEFVVMALLLAGDSELALYPALMDVLLLTLFATPLIYYFAIRPFVLDHHRMFEQAETAAFQDPLTGLPNRRQLEQHIERTHASAKRIGQQAALLYFDLDGFKQINEELVDVNIP